VTNPPVSEPLIAVMTCVAQVVCVPLAEARPERTLIDLGAQSFDFVEIVSRLEQQFGITLPRSFAIPDAYTIDDLAAAIGHAVAGSAVPRAGDGADAPC
jgi:acyl carrier protein